MKHLLCLIIIVSIAACSRKNTPDSSSSDQDTNPITIDDIKGLWRIVSFPYLDSIYNPKSSYFIDIGDAKLSFALEKNNCFVEYTSVGHTISINQSAICTEMCCDSKEMIAFSYLFKEDISFLWGKRPNVIHLKVDGGNIVLKKKKKDLYSALDKSSWKFISYGGSDIETHQKVRGDYQLSFRDRRAQVKLDVNTCNNSILEVNGNQFVLSSPLFGCTRMCCDKKEGLDMMNKMNQHWVLFQKDGFLELRSNQTTYVLEALTTISTE